MYSALLIIHSLFRWLVLGSLVFAIFRSYRGWLGNHPFTKVDHAARFTVTTISHVQLVIGLWLFFISPIVNYFWSNFSTAVHERQIRFFGMEHITMMVVAIILITIGSAKAKRKNTDVEKFKTMAVYFSIGLFIIFMSIPWSFSPLTSRPLFRGW